MNFSCPICGGPLWPARGALRCSANHSFDLSAESYVNLLPSNKKNSKHPGDNKEMMAARTGFLQTGRYDPMSDLVNTLLLEGLPESASVLDLGCGQGYYAARLLEAATRRNQTLDLYGVDISKDAVKAAAKHCRGGRFAVASLFALPFGDGVFSAAYNLFSPVCPREFHRVLGENGRLLMVHPGEKHLFGLKEWLYDAPYDNPPKEYDLAGFVQEKRERLCYEVQLTDAAEIQNLLRMTPYYYKSSPEALARAEKLTRLSTALEFEVLVYRKIEPIPKKIEEESV